MKRIRFSPCGGYLAAGTSKGSVLVYEIGGAQQEFPIANLKHSNNGKADSICVFGVDWGQWPDGQKFLVSGSHDHSCSFWNMSM